MTKGVGLLDVLLKQRIKAEVSTKPGKVIRIGKAGVMQCSIIISQHTNCICRWRIDGFRPSYDKINFNALQSVTHTRSMSLTQKYLSGYPT